MTNTFRVDSQPLSLHSAGRQHAVICITTLTPFGSSWWTDPCPCCQHHDVSHALTAVVPAPPPCTWALNAMLGYNAPKKGFDRALLISPPAAFMMAD